MNFQGPKIFSWWYKNGKSQSTSVKRDQLFLQGLASWWLENGTNGFVKWHMANFLDQIDELAEFDLSKITTNDLLQRKIRLYEALSNLEGANEICKDIFKKKVVTDGNITVPEKRKNDLGMFLVRAQTLYKTASNMVDEILCLAE